MTESCECGAVNPVATSADYVCRDCGLVQRPRFSSQRFLPTRSTPQHFYPVHVVALTNLGFKSERNGLFHRLATMHRVHTKHNGDHNFIRLFIQLTEFAQRLGLRRPHINQAQYLFRKHYHQVVEDAHGRGSAVGTKFIATLLLIVIRQNSLPIRIKTLVATFREAGTRIRLPKHLTSFLLDHTCLAKLVTRSQPSTFLQPILDAVTAYCPSYPRRSLELLTVRLINHWKAQGNGTRPATIAASALWIACRALREPGDRTITYTWLAEQAGVSSFSLRSVAADIRQTLLPKGDGGVTTPLKTLEEVLAE